MAISKYEEVVMGNYDYPLAANQDKATILIALQKKFAFEAAPFRALTDAKRRAIRVYVSCGFAATHSTSV